MRIVYGAVLLIFVAAIVIFCVQNLKTVSLTYLGWSASLPLPLLVVAIYFLGMVSGWGLIAFLRKSVRRATEHHE